MTPEQPCPKVFISHASEDKQRFVEELATRLRHNGVDAWLDQWEIMPGDDLPTSIFEKGIKDADAVIVVLSPHFVRKPWPQQELSASLIRRVRGDLRIIPVVIEECDIPQSLRATLWVRIPDLKNYDSEYSRLLKAIFEVSDKPSLGTRPAFAVTARKSIPGLNELDTQILAKSCELSLATASAILSSADVEALVRESAIRDEDAHDCLHILEDRGLIKPYWTFGGALPSYKISTRGFENYARFNIPEFKTIVDDALRAIVNRDLNTAVSIAKDLDEDPMLIEYILDILADRKLIALAGHRDGEEGAVIRSVTPQGRRGVAGQQDHRPL